MGSTLLLFTESYPYSAAVEDNFLEPELPYLQTAFEHVIVIPSRRDGTRADLPDGVEVDDGLASHLSERSATALVARALFSRLFWRDVVEWPSVLVKPRALRLLVRTVAQAELLQDWLTRFMPRRGITNGRCVAYTFWCNHAATGLALVKERSRELLVISRAHGADLYVERHDPPYLPCRRFTLSNLDRLFPDSERGTRYVAERYPWFASRCEVARMGVVNPGFVAAGSRRGRFSIVSCSLIVPVKRVDLILKGIARAAELRPETQFEWHHFGDGELKAGIEEEARASLPVNVTARFPGYPGLSELMKFYRTQPVDVFVNASVSEGTSVAVMEAVSCGIPVVASAVGGNSEIVSSLNGGLVSPTPTPDEIAHALFALIDSPEMAANKRTGSRRIWQSKYDAAAEYSAFARRLVELRASG